jgi:hypothetical protein
MTQCRLRKLYNAVRAAARAGGLLECEECETWELGDALDRFIEECDDPWEARLVEWAMVNGYPDFETVLRYSR